jgi:hypothetical protein
MENTSKAKKKKKVAVDGWQGVSRHGEWQWLGGSGVIRKVTSRRFEWHASHHSSGSIGSVAVV